MLNKNKKAVSTLIGYILLISLTMAMAGMVYAWMKFYVTKPFPEEGCPEGVSLTIADYKCNTADKTINITFRNQGRFDIDKVIVKMNNQSTDIAIYPLPPMVWNEAAGKMVEVPALTYISFSPVLAPGEEQTKMFGYSEYNNIALLEIEPAKGEDKYGTPILCEKAIQKIKINC